MRGQGHANAVPTWQSEIIKLKYLHANEKYATLKDLTIIWTIKEAIYKLFDFETLFFKEHIEVCSLNGKCIVNVDFKEKFSVHLLKLYRLRTILY